jgi:hypothetical protein
MTIKVTVPNTSGDYVTFGSANTPTAAQIGGYDDGSSNGHLELYTTASGTSTERMRITSAGNVGIGTSSPTAKLSIDKSSDAASPSRTPADYSIRLTAAQTNTYNGGMCAVESTYVSAAITPIDTGSGGAQGWAFITGDNSAIAERARIDSSGNFIVGATSIVASSKFGVAFNGSSFNGVGLNDTAAATGAGYVYFQSNGTTIGSITRVGPTSAVIYNTTSDQRLKSNIEDAAPVLEKLMGVPVRQYDWTEGDLHQDYGFVAQELEPLLSGVVTKGKEDEDMWQMDYSRLTPHLVKAIQELKAIVDTQAAKIAALEAK